MSCFDVIKLEFNWVLKGTILNAEVSELYFH